MGWAAVIEWLVEHAHSPDVSSLVWDVVVGRVLDSYDFR